jgi:hypothetical protein
VVSRVCVCGNTTWIESTTVDDGELVLICRKCGRREYPLDWNDEAD